MHIPVSDSSMVGEVRRTAAALAKEAGLDAEAAGRAALAATEMGTNLVKHAKEGTISIGSYSDAQGAGVELVAFDSGPGIADLPRAMSDGYSTAGSPGTGLGAIQRQATHFDIYSRLGAGTVLMARFGGSPSQTGRRGSVIGAMGTPYPGETECGDAWAYAEHGTLRRIMVADGSGHGHAAAAAAATAVKTFGEGVSLDGERLMQAIHRALFSTRGAAVAIARYTPDDREVRLVGVGNISAALVDGATTRRMISHNGTAGQIAPRIREFSYPTTNLPVIILHSDGLSSKWDLGAHPGLAAAHPSIIAAVLYRDHRRGRDDSLVVAVRILP